MSLRHPIQTRRLSRALDGQVARAAFAGFLPRIRCLFYFEEPSSAVGPIVCFPFQDEHMVPDLSRP